MNSTVAALTVEGIQPLIISEYEAAADFAVSVSFGLMSLLAVASLFGFLLHKLRE